MLALLTRPSGQKAIKGSDTFTVPRGAQAAGRIHPPTTWCLQGSVSIKGPIESTCRVTAESIEGGGTIPEPCYRSSHTYRHCSGDADQLVLSARFCREQLQQFAA